MSERIESFLQLHAYQKACELDLAVFVESKRWPKEEMFSLTDQVRRSSRAVGACIAEAWAKRRYPAHWIAKLTDADGELNETRHWIARAEAYGYLAHDCRVTIMQLADEIGRMLGRMVTKTDAFSGP